MVPFDQAGLGESHAVMDGGQVMKRLNIMRFGVVGLGGAALGAGALLAQAGAAGPTARYEMRAETTSGLGAGMMSGGAGGNGRPSLGSAMSMAFGGGQQAHRSLTLELGSTLSAPDGKPHADHFMPAGAKLGVSVPLKSPEVARGTREVDRDPQKDFQRPKARMLIFWGCGDHVGPGQPVVIDFSKIAAGQVPPDLFSRSVPLDRTVSPATSRTYGHWPNDDGKSVRTDSSLIGAHRIAGNYSPEIAFNLNHDFMGALRATTAPQASGATLLGWNALPDATGYYAFMFGAKGTGRGEPTDMVWWSSSSTREFGGGLTDWLSPGTVARLVTAGTVMAPQRTTCAIPAEVKQAAGEFMMTSLYAYGPEENFAFPPRPANPRVAWRPQWTARIKHRSVTSVIAGLPGSDTAEERREEAPKCKRKRGLGGLGGALGGALGSVVGGAAAGNGC
jgi:hypothetical protein